MVKIVEEAEEDRSESTSRRMSLDTSPPHTPSPRPSTSSSHYYHQNHLSSPPPSHTSPLPPGSPDSSSSISSAHTFHGFSAKPSPLPTPTHPPEPHQSPFSATLSPSPPPPRPVIAKKASVFNRLVRDEPPPSVAKTEPGPITGFADAGGTTDYESGMDGSVGGDEAGEGGGRRGSLSLPPPPSSSISRRAKRVIAVRRAALLLRWLEFAVCLVSFSVMTADRNRGWALDSFDRYKEFRYSLSVNVIGCVYSGLQGCCLAHQLRKGKHITQSGFWCYINFMVDQMLAYLLMSASSSAATRVDDWIMNWGNDKFTTMAGASVAMSFLAFAAFALSSMVSGYLLCTRRST